MRKAQRPAMSQPRPVHVTHEGEGEQQERQTCDPGRAEIDDPPIRLSALHAAPPEPPSKPAGGCPPPGLLVLP